MKKKIATRKLKTDPADRSNPKTTRAESSDRREPPNKVTSAAKVMGRKLDAMPDRVDFRDWPYQPTLQALPAEVVNIAGVPRILDQGQEGACTGFALAGVINYHLAARGINRSVSPRMLYEMARKYDDWPGEDYEGSSARGAMIGWVWHGVCTDKEWPATRKGAGFFSPNIATASRVTPGGAFYRVIHSQVRDVHAAIAETGAVYMTIMVHAGWDKPEVAVVAKKPQNNVTIIGPGRKKRVVNLPIIQRQGHATDGHAVAIVGYTANGFVIQNSWGTDWGYKGFALLPYEDFMIHATDVWAAQVGVPINCDVWTTKGAADTSAGLQRAADAIPLDEIRPYVVDCGNNGMLSTSGQYWTTEDDVKRLFTEVIPTATQGWAKKRVLLYLHGGLNTEQDVAKRVIAFRDVMKANEVYPINIMWETGFLESIEDIYQNSTSKPSDLAGGVPDWMKKIQSRLTEAKDRIFEFTISKLGTAAWGDMKRNADLSSTSPDSKGGMEIVAATVMEQLGKLPAAAKGQWEFHVVAHSAGSIYFAYALQHLMAIQSAGINFASVNFMAPACTIQLFRDLVLPNIGKGCPLPSMFTLSEVGELDDHVGASVLYAKSLLYLVSNAFEASRATPLLGMKMFIDADAEVQKLFSGEVNGHPALVVSGEAPVTGSPSPFSISRSNSHGGFDNDPDTLNSILMRIIEPAGGQLKRPFTTRDLQY